MASGSPVAVNEMAWNDLAPLDLTTVKASEVVAGAEIGRGEFAAVFVGTLRGATVAVKKQVAPAEDDVDDAAQVARALARELRVLAACDHAHVLRYVGACADPDRPVGDGGVGPGAGVWTVTEYAAGGDLLRLLEDAAVDLDWGLRLRVARELASALAYLHGRELLHRDVKAANVFLDGDYRVKLGDFGMATACGDGGRASTLCGTEAYMAPELLLDGGEGYGAAVDVFAFGCVLAELGLRAAAAAALPRSPRDLFALDDDDLRARLSARGAPGSYVELAAQCLGYEDHERPAADRAAQESDIPNFKGSFLGRFPLVSADFWTSDRLSERSRSVDTVSGTRARGTLTLKRR